jgi:hypothetical protein
MVQDGTRPRQHELISRRVKLDFKKQHQYTYIYIKQNNLYESIFKECILIIHFISVFNTSSSNFEKMVQDGTRPRQHELLSRRIKLDFKKQHQ